MIRNARKEDINAIIALCKEHAIYEKASYSPENKAMLLSNVIFSSNPKVYCLVVEENDALVGYATYTIQYSTWDANEYIYLDCIYLKENSRGKNLGQRLIQKIATLGEKHNCSLMQWHTPVWNEGAIRFYNRLGAYSKSKERFFLAI